jgi:hypothetical protein
MEDGLTMQEILGSMVQSRPESSSGQAGEDLH